MNAPEIEIVPLEESHVERAVSIIAAAFLEEPGAVAVIRRDPAKRLRILQRHFRTHVGLNFRKGVSRCAFLDGEMVGVMLLSAPGKPAATNLEMLTFLWRMLFHVSPEIMWRGLQSSLVDDENHRPKEPNYYLETIAVEPKLQGRGIGATLLRYLTELADKEGVLIYLGTTDPSKVPLYEKHGFRTTAKSAQSGVPNCHMQREPKIQ